jgi:hypothetical protein
LRQNLKWMRLSSVIILDGDQGLCLVQAVGKDVLATRGCQAQLQDLACWEFQKLDGMVIVGPWMRLTG